MTLNDYLLVLLDFESLFSSFLKEMDLLLAFAFYSCGLDMALIHLAFTDD